MKRKTTLKLENDIQILENKMNLNPTEFIQPSLNQKKRELENRRQDTILKRFHLKIFLGYRKFKKGSFIGNMI
jgi:hypothetical protein